MKVSSQFLTVLFALLFSIKGIAQENKKESLHKILNGLETRFHITFAYVDENIEGIFIPLPPRKLNLEKTLNYLQKNTGLIYQKLSERYVTISKTETGSYNICGVITYSDTGEAVAGATIHAGKKFLISGENGFFHLTEISGDSIVHIRSVGYESLDIPVVHLIGKTCKDISLKPQFTTLQTVFVSDFITQGIDKKVDGALVINAQDLGMLPGLTEPDVLQAIQTLPGIQSINETISDINVRGGTNDQNLVLWDGIRMYHSGHFFGLISAYNPYLTEKVTLTKNGSSAYLGDGVSSTIDIRTDDQLAEKFSAGAGMNMVNGDIFAKVPITDKVALHLSGRRSVADLLQTPTYKRYFERTFRNTDVTNASGTDTLLARTEKFYFYDTSFKLLYNISAKEKLRLSFLNIFNDIEYQKSGLLNNIVKTRTSGLEQRNLGSSFSYSRLWNEKIRTSASIYLSSYRLGSVNYDLLNDQRLIQENKVLDTGIKLDTRVNLTSNIGIFSGYQFFEVGVTNLEDINNPSFRRSVKKVVRNHAAFLDSDFTFSHTNIRVGVRSNYFPGFKKYIIEPRFSFNQNFLKHFFFEILGEMKNQSITQIIDLQTDFLGVEKRRWVLSNNDDIPIIESKQISTGIYFKKEGYLVSAEGYYKLVDGIITSSQGFQNQFQFIRSTGNYKTIGVDFLINKKFDRFTSWLSYSNAKSSFEFPQLIPPSFPNNLDIRHRLTFGCSYQTNRLGLSTGINWHSGKPFTEPTQTDPILNNKIRYNTPNSSRLDDYLRLDISAKYQFYISNKLRAEVIASIWNILNRQNIVDAYFLIADNDQLEPVKRNSLTLTPNIILRANLF